MVFRVVVVVVVVVNVDKGETEDVVTIVVGIVVREEASCGADPRLCTPIWARATDDTMAR